MESRSINIRERFTELVLLRLDACKECSATVYRMLCDYQTKILEECSAHDGS